MKINKKRILLAILCVIVLVLCSYYFATREKNNPDNTDAKSQAQITLNNSFPF